MKLSIIAYSSQNLFKSYLAPTEFTSGNFSLSSQVISVQANKKFTVSDGRLVTLIFRRNSSDEAKARQCFFLDMVENKWSSDGCKFERQGDLDLCICDHTTNFAMLFVTCFFNFLNQIFN